MLDQVFPFQGHDLHGFFELVYLDIAQLMQGLKAGTGVHSRVVLGKSQLKASHFVNSFYGVPLSIICVLQICLPLFIVNGTHLLQLVVELLQVIDLCFSQSNVPIYLIDLNRSLCVQLLHDSLQYLLELMQFT